METEDSVIRRQQPVVGQQKARLLEEILEEERMKDQECFEDLARLRELLRAWRVGQADLLRGCMEHQLRCLQRAVLDEGSGAELSEDGAEPGQDSTTSQADRNSR